MCSSDLEHCTATGGPRATQRPKPGLVECGPHHHPGSRQGRDTGILQAPPARQPPKVSNRRPSKPYSKPLRAHSPVLPYKLSAPSLLSWQLSHSSHRAPAGRGPRTDVSGWWPGLPVTMTRCPMGQHLAPFWENLLGHSDLASSGGRQHKSRSWRSQRGQGLWWGLNLWGQEAPGRTA